MARFLIPAFLLTSFSFSTFEAAQAQDPQVMTLWKDSQPGPLAKTDGPERDLQKPSDRRVGGSTVMKLGHVASPEIHVFPADAQSSKSGACVICPGGGFSILAWDLEGTEIAKWLNSFGVTAIVLKYRVPTGAYGEPEKWQGPVMDAQRALSMGRSRASEWNIDSQRIGILGFSAGGHTAARTAMLNNRRLYKPMDKIDSFSCAADYSILIYPAWLVDDKGNLKTDLKVSNETPPSFLVHAANDRVSCESSVQFFLALRKAKVNSELHVYHDGGHGYGLRKSEKRVTGWPSDAKSWLAEIGMLEPPKQGSK